MPDVTGICRGGPFDGKPVTVHSTDPWMATDRRDNRVWVYRWDGRGAFVVDTDHDSTLTLPQGSETGERRLDWDRLDRSPLAEIPVVDTEENQAGGPVGDEFTDLPPGDPEAAR